MDKAYKKAYKKGQTLRIVKRMNCHLFKLGEEVTVIEIDGGCYRVINSRNQAHWVTAKEAVRMNRSLWSKFINWLDSADLWR